VTFAIWAKITSRQICGGPMTTRTYKYGKYSCKAYKKPCGRGYEVGMTYAGQECFVGNFIHAKEANAWWTKMNYEMRKFQKKYVSAQWAPTNFTCKFLSNTMYKAYYSYLDREFTKYHRGFSQAVKQNERRYRKTWAHTPGTYHWRRAA
jgi:hypothetical protein